MKLPDRRLLHAWLLALATAALLIGGCTTIEPVREPTVSRLDPRVRPAAPAVASGRHPGPRAPPLRPLEHATP
ncbi:hypothetical protein, partial [Lysobacter sp. A03]|uniref:hypothetical protein n=1 Tax=Lysobacter sp. A03 TaxID=1199154 RepID=UPI000A97F45D